MINTMCLQLVSRGQLINYNRNCHVGLNCNHLIVCPVNYKSTSLIIKSTINSRLSMLLLIIFVTSYLLINLNHGQQLATINPPWSSTHRTINLIISTISDWNNLTTFLVDCWFWLITMIILISLLIVCLIALIVTLIISLLLFYIILITTTSKFVSSIIQLTFDKLHLRFGKL